MKTELLRIAADLDQLTASLKTSSYDPGIYKLMEKAHGEIKDYYPEASDEAILGVVGPWFAGKLVHTQIPKTPFASDKGKQIFRILTGIR